MHTLEIKDLHVKIKAEPEHPEILTGVNLKLATGEIHAIISNVSSESQILSKDTRVGQLVITPVLIADFVLDLGEARDTGAFGSTGE